MYRECNTLDPYTGQEHLQQEARAWWHETLAGVGEVESRVKTFIARYAGSYEVQGWSRTGRGKTREAYHALGGRKRENPDDPAGKFGRFIVSVGLPFETSDIDFGLIPELAAFRDLPEAQFDQEIIDIAQRAIDRLLGSGVPYVLVVERGAKNGYNHLHVAHAVGACPVGRKTLNKTPQDALECARYLLKGPQWGLENLVAYVSVRRLQGRAGRRLRYGRLGSHRITCGDVQRVLGFSVLKQSEVNDRSNHVGHCGLPTPSSESYERNLPVIPKHAWYGGVPVARELLKPEPVKLHRTLSDVLRRLEHRERPVPVRPARRHSPIARHRPALIERWGVSPPLNSPTSSALLYA